MNLRTLTAIALGKTITSIQKTRRRGATAAPGYYALKLDSGLINQLTNNRDVILITGTNGKTTTSRFISSILNKAGIPTIHNRAGSNLERGIASTLIQNFSFKKEDKVGIFEVDEAVFPRVLKQLTPKIVVINNLFRDQLDRYGEVSKIHQLWKTALATLPNSSTVVLNTDDPNVADLGENLTAKVNYFGIDDPESALEEIPHTIDARVCLRCSSPLEYDYFHMAHLGKYHCTNCDFKRPSTAISASFIKLDQKFGCSYQLNFSGQKQHINLTVSGLYNIYNSLAACAAAEAYRINPNVIKTGLETFEAGFGRQQIIPIGGKNISLNLVKNPVGYNEVVRTLTNRKEKLNLFLLLNDHLADGTDVSWIWDVDFEKILGKTNTLSLSGTRAADLAVRLKYAGIGIDTDFHSNIEKSLDKALDCTPFGETLYVLPTYTAMMDLQDILARRGFIKPFWEN